MRLLLYISICLIFNVITGYYNRTSLILQAPAFTVYTQDDKRIEYAVWAFTEITGITVQSRIYIKDGEMPKQLSDYQDIAGLCLRHKFQILAFDPNIIILDKNIFISDYVLITTLWHELAHCELGIKEHTSNGLMAAFMDYNLSIDDAIGELQELSKK